MKIKKLLFIFSPWFMIMGCQQNLTATYYISPSGNDSHSGTSAQTPWRTVNKVNGVDLNPGDRVLFEAGYDYPGNLLLTAEDAGTPTQPVIIGSYGSGRARIRAGNGSGVTVKDAGGIEVKNLIVIGDDYKTNVGSGIKIVNELLGNQKLEYIRIHNVEASGFGRRRSSEGFQWPNGCGIFVGGNPSDKSMSGYRNVYITNCTTYKNEYYGVLTMGYGETIPDTYANVNVYVGYCKAYDNPGDPEYRENHSGSGILTCDADGGVIEYCEAYNNGYDCGDGPGPVGIWATESNGVIIQYCESHHNRTSRSDGGGFDFDGGTTNSIMQYNYSHDNDGGGYLIYSYENAPHTDRNSILRYNISINDGQKRNSMGIALLNNSPIDNPIHNTQIYGNTVYASSGPALRIGKNGIYNTKVCNNLFITANNRKLLVGNTDKSMVTFTGNAYWAVEGKHDIAGYKSLEAWRDATGQEMLNGKPVGLVADPGLIDMGKSVTIGDPTKLHTLTAYRLQKDSPLIDAGLDLRSLFGIDPGDRDFFGNSIPQGKAYDIGAHEIILENTSSVEQK
jgi:hypothetical protein